MNCHLSLTQLVRPSVSGVVWCGGPIRNCHPLTRKFHESHQHRHRRQPRKHVAIHSNRGHWPPKITPLSSNSGAAHCQERQFGVSFHGQQNQHDDAMWIDMVITQVGQDWIDSFAQEQSRRRIFFVSALNETIEAAAEWKSPWAWVGLEGSPN